MAVALPLLERLVVRGRSAAPEPREPAGLSAWLPAVAPLLLSLLLRRGAGAALPAGSPRALLAAVGTSSRLLMPPDVRDAATGDLGPALAAAPLPAALASAAPLLLLPARGDVTEALAVLVLVLVLRP